MTTYLENELLWCDDVREQFIGPVSRDAIAVVVPARRVDCVVRDNCLFDLVQLGGVRPVDFCSSRKSAGERWPRKQLERKHSDIVSPVRTVR